MIGFAAVCAAIFIIGLAVARAAWLKLDGPRAQEETGAFELAAAGGVVGLALWLACSWLLALTHSLTRPAMVGLSVLFIIAAAVIAVRFAPRLRGREIAVAAAVTVGLLLLPVGIWVDFALWRGAVVPPLAHDALAYHLPKAILLVKHNGYEPVYAPDWRIVSLPSNYELLLADVLLLARSESLTEWIATVMYLLFLIATAAMAERWWGRGVHILAAILATAVTPLLLLQSGTIKNDIMMGLFGATAFLWGARWTAQGGRMAMALLMISLVLGVGTKPNVAAIGLALAPFLIAAAVRRLRSGALRPRDILITACFGVVLFVVAGGATYIHSFIATGIPVAAQVDGGSVTPVKYGEWRNLWQVPYLMLTAPFSPNPLGVWVPWRHEYWFWPRYEMFFSHFGPLFTILVIALPFCVWRYGGEEPRDRAAERRTAGLAAAMTLIIMLPVEMRPVGFFAAFPRYALFLLPVVICWTIVPFVRSLQRRRRAAIAVLATLALFFCVQAVEYGVRDRFMPLEYVRWAAQHRGNRSIWFMPRRAASVVDRMAGPTDTIAVEGSIDTWTYPAWGAGLTRTVVFLPPNATLRDIPRAANWIIVDRSWNAIWGHPKLTDMGQFWTYINRGTPSPEDVRVLEMLRRSRDFKLVYHAPRTNQAVFRRVGAVAQ